MSTFFAGVADLHFDAPFPELVLVRQNVEQPWVEDMEAATRTALEAVRARIRPGMSVALTAGSRGIADMPAVLRAAGRWLVEAGAEPFIVPAMGSHGGATAEGQVELLAHLGVSAATIGVPVRATMETVDLGPSPGGPNAYLDAEAARADGILLVNRVKPHTDFRGAIESGLAKICAIGLGKQRGAQTLHAYGSPRLAELVPVVARHIVERAPVLGGLAIVENASHRTAALTFVPPEGIAGAAEAALLAESARLMGHLPFDELDLLVVDRMGKDISGSGLDTNVIGRMAISVTDDLPRPRIAMISVHDLTPGSDGNALGIGLADVVPIRLLEQIDLRSTYLNTFTSGIGAVQRARLPMAFATDRDAIAAGLLMCGRADPENARVVRIRDTLDPLELLVSTSLLPEVAARPGLEVLGAAGPLSFDGDGRLIPWPAKAPPR